MNTGDFTPDWTVPPGASIEEALEELGLSIDDAASELGIEPSFLQRLILGREVVSPLLASGLARVLGSTPQFWSRLEQQYRQDLARLRTHDPLL